MPPEQALFREHRCTAAGEASHVPDAHINFSKYQCLNRSFCGLMHVSRHTGRIGVDPRSRIIQASLPGQRFLPMANSQPVPATAPIPAISISGYSKWTAATCFGSRMIPQTITIRSFHLMGPKSHFRPIGRCWHPRCLRPRREAHVFNPPKATAHAFPVRTGADALDWSRLGW